MSVHTSPQPISLNYRAIAEDFAELAVAAGAAVMLFYNGDSHAREKGDTSPVCDADLAGEAVILAGLAARLPGLPVVSEEAAAAGAKSTAADAFILVDPVDGTREFLAGKGEFTVNIGLVVHGVPTVGAVYAPALERMWLAGDGAFTFSVAPGGRLPPLEHRQSIRARPLPPDGLVALTSWSHADPRTTAFLDEVDVKERRMIGSSLKFCALADGSGDIYPRFGATMEWDTAAGDAVLRAAGGAVLDREGQPLLYGKTASKFMNGSFVAWADPAAVATVLGARRA
jgi:3'(2'),5'-bisphosphate nucleotidase